MLPPFTPGRQPIATLNRVVEQVNRSAADSLSLSRRLGERPGAAASGFFARITGPKNAPGADALYEFAEAFWEADSDDPDYFTGMAAGRGTEDGDYAVELRGNVAVPTGAIVWMREVRDHANDRRRWFFEARSTDLSSLASAKCWRFHFVWPSDDNWRTLDAGQWTNCLFAGGCWFRAQNPATSDWSAWIQRPLYSQYWMQPFVAPNDSLPSAVLQVTQGVHAGLYIRVAEDATLEYQAWGATMDPETIWPMQAIVVLLKTPSLNTADDADIVRDDAT